MNDRLLGLLIEFDEMGFAPTTVCADPEEFAVRWKEQVLKEIKLLEVENDALRQGKKAAVEDVAERIKTGIFCELADDLTFKMAGRIEKIIKEVLNEHEL